MSNEQSIRDELVDRINDELDKWGEGSPSPYAIADAISPVIRRIQAEAWNEGALWAVVVDWVVDDTGEAGCRVCGAVYAPEGMRGEEHDQG